MRAGELRQRITLQAKSASKNDYGEDILTWSDVATVWAKVEPLKGRERLSAGQEQQHVSTRILIRYRSGVTPDYRVKLGTRIYDVEMMRNIEERDRLIELMCTEHLQAGAEGE